MEYDGLETGQRNGQVIRKRHGLFTGTMALG